MKEAKEAVKPLSRAELRAALVPRLDDDHKGVFGHVLVVAGSRGMSGAALLSTRAALRSGAGLVTLALPAGLQAALCGHAPEALTLGLPENSSGAARPEGAGRLKQAHKERRYTALVIGPGLGTHPDTARFVLHALSSLDVPAVVDADALNTLAEQEPGGVRQLLRARRQPCVFTPHPGEMARCLRSSAKEINADRLGAARGLAREWGGVAVLKGRGTVIASSERAALNGTGGPGLAKGGTGDVLAGLLGGLWAQLLASRRVEGDAAFLAAALAAHVHGSAGELAEKALGGRAMTAQNVIEQLGPAFDALA